MTFFQKSTGDGQMLLKDLSTKGPISKLNTFEMPWKVFLGKVLFVKKEAFGRLSKAFLGKVLLV